MIDKRTTTFKKILKKSRLLCGTTAIAATMMLSAGAVTPASAATWSLFDHGHGSDGPFYGLRLDAESKHFSFGDISTTQSTLSWDGVSTIASISGTIWLNEDPDTAAGTDGPPDGQAWTLSYNLTGVAASGAGFTAAGGTGVVTNTTDIADFINLTGKAAGGSVFNFLFDGHRCETIPACGPNDPVARGWIDRSGTNDFLLRAAVVPLPAPLVLLLSGLLGLGFLGRYRSKAAA